jgi:hypothetical protein
MDLNLHLLKPNQLRLIQDICKIEGPIYDHLFEGFEEVRDKIDLIILDDSTGYDMYIEDLRYEEEEIRERLRKEKMQREQGELEETKKRFNTRLSAFRSNRQGNQARRYKISRGS